MRDALISALDVECPVCLQPVCEFKRVAPCILREPKKLAHPFRCPLRHAT